MERHRGKQPSGSMCRIRWEWLVEDGAIGLVGPDHESLDFIYLKKFLLEYS